MMKKALSVCIVIILAAIVIIYATRTSDHSIANTTPKETLDASTNPSSEPAEDHDVNAQSDLKSFQECFTADLPDGWTISCEDSIFMATLSYHDEEAGTFTLHTPWTTDADEMATSILGDHAYINSDINDTDMVGFIRRKVTIGYQLSESETENGETAPDGQIHYFYFSPELSEDASSSIMKDTDWVADLYFFSDAIYESQMDDIASCIQMTY